MKIDVDACQKESILTGVLRQQWVLNKIKGVCQCVQSTVYWFLTEILNLNCIVSTAVFLQCVQSTVYGFLTVKFSI